MRMPGLFGGSAEHLRLTAQRHIAVADDYAARGLHGQALAENLAAARITSRLRKIEPSNRRHCAVTGSLNYNLALHYEQTGQALRSITAARNSIAAYERLDPTQGEERPVCDAVADTPPLTDGGEPIDAARLIAHLADARSRLAYLLGTYGAPDRHRDRELRWFDLDPELTLEHEINTLDAKACLAYKSLVHCSRYTDRDLNRVLEQGGQAMGNYHARFPRSG